MQQYYGTLASPSKGLARTACEELREKVKATNIESATGKVFFDTPLTWKDPELRSVRSLERICLNVRRSTNVTELDEDRTKALDDLVKYFALDTDWRSVVQYWQCFRFHKEQHL
ncbi:hypothetical protein CYMTET_11978 [Cymbomonas tetramitiformis]|uniref:Uncharacterized protein n=1 Tax=Cymbomonas tetramitiformis TaxID=36881 RepID=A0AAE0GL06_9CHLO|nr:hypothetical protein CYMTET_11978 [Cymbomonas tetramitiformis]